MTFDTTDPRSSYTTAVCRGINEFEEPLLFVRLPGEECDIEQDLYICGFGKKICYNKKCLGYNELDDEDCNMTENCNPTYYCSKTTNRCTPYKLKDEECYEHEECGRIMLCRKTVLGATIQDKGVCTLFFSQDKEEFIDVRDESLWIQFQCKSGYADTRTQVVEGEEGGTYSKCGHKIKSENAGQICTTSSDCPTNIDNYASGCSCTPNEAGLSYCEYESGNYEWIDLKNKFGVYIDATQTCHISRGLDFHCYQTAIASPQ